jgi:hypothetical protein
MYPFATNGSRFREYDLHYFDVMFQEQGHPGCDVNVQQEMYLLCVCVLRLLALGDKQRGFMYDATLWMETFPLDCSLHTSTAKVVDEQCVLHEVDLRRKTHLRARDYSFTPLL